MAKVKPEMIVTCISRQARKALLDIDSDELRAELDKIPECIDGEDVGFKKGKGSRAPSPYNTFIGKCMKDKKIKTFGDAPGAMKSCAADWRKQKGA